MEWKMSQGNSLCSYLKQTKMSFFSFTKSENKKEKKVLSKGGGMWVKDVGG
jgi:hypothetical protein